MTLLKDVVDGKTGEIRFVDLENYDKSLLDPKYTVVRKGNEVTVSKKDGTFVARYRLRGDNYMLVEKAPKK